MSGNSGVPVPIALAKALRKVPLGICRCGPRDGAWQANPAVAATHRRGLESGGSALLVKPNDRLPAGDSDFAVDHRAFRNGNGTRDDVGVDDSG